MGAVWEFISSVTRTNSIKGPFNQHLSQVTFVFLVLARLWFNAFDYMVLGRMVYYHLPDKQLVGIKAQRFAVYFVCLDIAWEYLRVLNKRAILILIIAHSLSS
jgi:hypothetical protein